MEETRSTTPDYAALLTEIRAAAAALGFADLAVADIDLSHYRRHLERWLADGFHGEMGYMARNVEKRLDPSALEPYAARVISARIDYLPPDTQPLEILRSADRAYISRYALGRDYHKVVRSRLARLATRIRLLAGGNHRAFTDSAPVLEKALAEKAGLGWIGKHTLLLNRDAGSWFFLGEIYTDLPLPLDREPHKDDCGRCSACMTVCPTGAIVAPRRLDARRCISYLTIEHKGSIPVELRRPIGNRVFGCDDCQLACPWNRFATPSQLKDFAPRHALDRVRLLDLFGWSESEFLARTEGSALRRASYAQWRRNLAVALGNAPADPSIVAALERARDSAVPLVREHIDWALAEQRRKAAAPAEGGEKALKPSAD